MEYLTPQTRLHTPEYTDCLFFRFKYQLISKWMGDTTKSVYITMIRDPVDIFISAWHYYKLGSKYYHNMTLGMFGHN